MATHPLDPLSQDEQQSVIKILKDAGHLIPTTRIATILLQEPLKQFVFSWEPGRPFLREANVTLFDNARNLCSTVLVSLTESKVLSTSELPGVQAIICNGEIEKCEEVMMKSELFRSKIVEHYGSEVNFENLLCAPWSAGYYGDEGDGDARLSRPYCFFMDDKSGHGYSYPIEGLRPVVDLNKMEVIRVEDYGKVPLPPEHFSYFEARTTPNQRTDIKPLEILQEDGPSFQVSGSQVNWQKYSFTVGFNAIEGLVIHDLRYDGRSILYRAAISDMIVPYGDPSPTHARKNVFDVGEYGLGHATIGQRLEFDCLGLIRYIDAELVNDRGEPQTVENAICLHEEDYGTLWKHFDRHSGANEIRRSRRLAISTIAAVGNYDYGFYWYLYQDGTIELQVKLTGILSLGAKGPGETAKYGNFVAPQLYAPNHQHIFNYRLDFAIDGVNNTVSKVDVVPTPEGSDNPFNNGFFAQKTPFETELEARSNVDLETGRTWDISNENKKNQAGMPVAYKLIPGENSVAKAHPDAWWRKRARFADYHVWVTPFDPAEFQCAGDFPNQAPEDTGLSKWTQKNRPIRNQDCVLWYTFGVTHVPRPEDYPVMPTARAGFKLKPNGFFDRNPAFDVPPQGQVNRSGRSCRTSS